MTDGKALYDRRFGEHFRLIFENHLEQTLNIIPYLRKRERGSIKSAGKQSQLSPCYLLHAEGRLKRDIRESDACLSFVMVWSLPILLSKDVW